MGFTPVQLLNKNIFKLTHSTIYYMTIAVSLNRHKCIELSNVYKHQYMYNLVNVPTCSLRSWITRTVPSATLCSRLIRSSLSCRQSSSSNLSSPCGSCILILSIWHRNCLIILGLRRPSKSVMYSSKNFDIAKDS